MTDSNTKMKETPNTHSYHTSLNHQKPVIKKSLKRLKNILKKVEKWQLSYFRYFPSDKIVFINKFRVKGKKFRLQQMDKLGRFKPIPALPSSGVEIGKKNLADGEEQQAETVGNIFQPSIIISSSDEERTDETEDVNKLGSKNLQNIPSEVLLRRGEELVIPMSLQSSISEIPPSQCLPGTSRSNHKQSDQHLSERGSYFQNLVPSFNELEAALTSLYQQSVETPTPPPQSISTASIPQQQTPHSFTSAALRSQQPVSPMPSTSYQSMLATPTREQHFPTMPSAALKSMTVSTTISMSKKDQYRHHCSNQNEDFSNVNRHQQSNNECQTSMSPTRNLLTPLQSSTTTSNVAKTATEGKIKRWRSGRGIKECECGKIFKSHLMLKEHQYVECDFKEEFSKQYKKKNHTCDCGKSFVSYFTFKKHEKRFCEFIKHQDEPKKRKQRNYTCECGRKYGRSSTLQKHQTFCEVMKAINRQKATNS